MMQELVDRLSQKTGLSQDQAQQAVTVVVNHLKEKLPAPLASGLDSILADSSTSGGDSMFDRARTAAASLEGMFGKKTE